VLLALNTEELFNLVPADGGTHKSPLIFYSRYSRSGQKLVS
jgi:hypothetical protein